MTDLFTVIGDTSGRVASGQGDVTTGSVYVRLVDLGAAGLQPVLT